MSFLKTGNSDCILIKYDGKVVMIDTATEISYQNIENVLNARNIDTIDYLIITHFDKDHVGSAAKIINNFEVKKVFQTYLSKNSHTYHYKKYKKALKNNNLKAVTVLKEYIIEIDDVVLSIIPPEKRKYSEQQSNNSSLITKLNYNNRSFLFCGDIENERIGEILNDPFIKADVLKMPHHGYSVKNSKQFINNVAPKISVITNSYYKNPCEIVVSSNLQNRAQVFFTNQGTIDITTDGVFLKVHQK